MSSLDLNYDLDARTISNIMLPKSSRSYAPSVLTARKAPLFTSAARSASSSIGTRVLVAASIAIGTMIPSMAFAADVFVRDARGTSAQTPSPTDVTDMVKSAVESMPEHQLVDNEAGADFVLRPRLLNRTNGWVLHIDRYRGDTLLSSSEELLPKVQSDEDGAYDVVVNAFKGNEAPNSQVAGDRAQTPTYAEEASQTREVTSVGAKQTPDSGASNTEEMAKANPTPQVSTPEGNSLAARYPGSTTQLNDSQDKSAVDDQVQARAAQSGQSESQVRGTAATPATPNPDQPMKTIASTSTAAPVPEAGHPHPMNPSVADEPASDYGSASGNEIRSDGFKRTSIFGGPGYFNAAVGAGFSGGLRADNTMLDVNAGYAIDYTPLLTGKAFVDMNLGTGGDVAQFVDIAVGANYFPPQVQTSKSKPYVGGDLGLGIVRNNVNDGQSSLAAGVSGGFQFLADTANLDVGLRYEVLATQIDGSTAQLLGLKVGANF